MNILTTQAASVLRDEETDEDMVNLLPLIDGFIKNATRRDSRGYNYRCNGEKRCQDVACSLA